MKFSRLYISKKVLAREMALQLRALQFLAGKSDLPVTSSIRALQFLAGKSDLPVTSSKRALQYLNFTGLTHKYLALYSEY